MNKLILSIILVFVFIITKAQTIYLQEDFSTASGTTPPTGWTVQTVTGDQVVDVWHFDNPGRRSPAVPINGNFACFDSDKLSNNGLAEEVYLTSPVFDATTNDNIILEFDQYFQEGFSASGLVEVFNGSNWIIVYTNSVTTSNPQHSTFDITNHIQNKTNVKIRFKWSGNYSWYWIVDNIKIITQPIINELFTEQTNLSLTQVAEGAGAWGDYDNDGLLDVLLTGYPLITKINHNNGDNTFTEETSINLVGIYYSSVDWGDYNNDGFIDFVLTGSSAQGSISKIYRNDGGNNFIEQSGIDLVGTSRGSIKWGDYDNDGLQDILVTGSGFPAIYHNNGDNTFTLQSNFSVYPVSYSNGSWGDYDNDGDFDIILTGSTRFMDFVTKIYRNDGNNTFTEQTDILLTGVEMGSSTWGDYDNDGDLDILLTGKSINPQNPWDPYGIPISKVYRNNGNNTFTEQTNILLSGVRISMAAWGDYDNDGNLDILLSGETTTGLITKVYKNNGDNTFSELEGIHLTGYCVGSVIWGDYDNDNDLDILLTGNTDGLIRTKIYKNNSSKKNTKPTPPSNISGYVLNKKVVIAWDKATDSETPQLGLTYNLRIGTTPGGCEILSPMALSNGTRTVAAIGNIEHNNKWTVDLSNISPLPEKIYYSVQTIDNGLLGSEWSPEESELSNFVADFLPNTACQKSEIQFQNISYSMNYPITNYLWKFTEGTKLTTSSLQNPLYTFQTAGTHLVELIITNSNGETTNHTKNIIVALSPLVDFITQDVCLGVPVILDNITLSNSTIINRWLWDFGDNTTNSNDEKPDNHGYINPGDFLITLKAFADNGCVGAISKTVSIANNPIAEISADGPLLFCKSDSTTLSVPYNIKYIYKWLENGIYITDADSSKYVARTTGNFNVEVVNTIANCKTTSSQVAITAQNTPISPIIVNNTPTQFCQGDSLILSVTNIAGYTYQWKLNGGAIGTNSNQIVAKSAGAYTVSVTNSSGCITNSINTINVVVNSNPTIPTVNVSGATSFCQGGSVNLSVINNPNYIYQWQNTGANILSETKNVIEVKNPGIYNLSITSTDGCKSTTEKVLVDVSPLPVAPYISTIGPLQLCRGDSVILSITNLPEHTYQWKFNGDGLGLSSDQIVAKNAGIYSATIFNSKGCSINSTNSVTVIVNDLPRLSPVSLSGSTEFCEGDSLIMSVPLTIGVTYQWFNYLNPIEEKNSNRFSVKSSGQYYLQILNETDCKISSLPINVKIKSIPAIPQIVTENYQPGKCNIESPITISVDQPVSGLLYQWKRNGIPVEKSNGTYIQDYLPMGDYTVEVNNDGCKNESKPQNIFFENALEKPFILAKGPTVWYLVCSNNSAENYQWYYNGIELSGANKSIYIANQNLGKYYVTIANEVGCITASDVIQIPTGITGIADVNPFKVVNIYPNPTPGLFTIEMDNNILGDLLIDILNQTGSKVLNIKFDKSTEHFMTQIDLSGQSKGMYIINLAIKGYKATRKLIVE